MMMSMHFFLRPCIGFALMHVMRCMHVALFVVRMMGRVAVSLAAVVSMQQMMNVRNFS